jgi:hypothetical protein
LLASTRTKGIFQQNFGPLMKKHAVMATLLISILGCFLVAGLGARAQVPGAGGPAGMTAAMSKLFGEIKGFSAKAEAQVLNSSQKELVKMPMDFEFLDGKMRVAIDMAQMKNSTMPPGAAEQLKQMGMSRVTSIIRPDKSLAYVIYPDNKVLTSVPIPKDEDPKIKKTPGEKETIDGHPCIKTKVVITDAKGQSVDATTWNATDLKNFPIQIQAQDKENTTVMRFSNVQLASPSVQDFDPPSGYTQYTNQQEMMQAIISKLQAGQPAQK